MAGAGQRLPADERQLGVAGGRVGTLSSRASAGVSRAVTTVDPLAASSSCWEPTLFKP